MDPMDTTPDFEPCATTHLQGPSNAGRRNFQFFIDTYLCDLRGTIWDVADYATIGDLKLAWLQRVYPHRCYWKVRDNVKAIKLFRMGKKLENEWSLEQADIKPAGTKSESASSQEMRQVKSDDEKSILESGLDEDLIPDQVGQLMAFHKQNRTAFAAWTRKEKAAKKELAGLKHGSRNAALAPIDQLGLWQSA